MPVREVGRIEWGLASGGSLREPGILADSPPTEVTMARKLPTRSLAALCRRLSLALGSGQEARGVWQREASHAPKPPTPMYQSMYFGYRNEGAKRSWDEFSPLFETIDYREIGGWEYIRVVPLGGVDRKPPPAWLLLQLPPLF